MRSHRSLIADVAAHEGIARIAVEARQILDLTRVGQGIENRRTLPRRVVPSQCRTKLAPMNPAPPVIRTLCGSKLIQHVPQIVPPVLRWKRNDRPR